MMFPRLYFSLLFNNLLCWFSFSCRLARGCGFGWICVCVWCVCACVCVCVCVWVGVGVYDETRDLSIDFD